jgi:hypothetical protein
VRTVEINARDFNPGEPPTDISIFEERSAATRDASHPETQRKNDKGSSNTPTQAKQSGPAGHTVLNFDESNPSTTDVIWFRNKTKLTGRLVRIEDGQLTIESGRDSKKFNLGDVATVLVAPD